MPDNCFSFTAVQPYLSIVKYLNEIQLEDIHQPMASNSERYTLVSLILKVVKYFLAQKYFSSAPALRPSGPAVRDLSWQLQRWSDVYISAKHLPPCQPVCTTTMHQCETQKTNTKYKHKTQNKFPPASPCAKDKPSGKSRKSDVQRVL